ncbi:response regulator transcription factor [Streptomyces phaeochromogenes]|uniref:helix-turn-helix transcriptional regulator n=1 Tax=Streptomyces phaeochromogenes TaxID=1923 RepID=UPI0036A7DC08
MGCAVLDADEQELTAGLRSVAVHAPGLAPHCIPAAAHLWRALTGRALAPAAVPTAPVQAAEAVTHPVAEPGHLALLHEAVSCLVSAEYGQEGRRSLAALAPRLPDPNNVPLDLAWSTWMAVIARTSALTGDAPLCREVVEQLGPFTDQFAVLGLYLPVGPVGWFLAEPLWLLGRVEEAPEANARAERLCRGLRSRAWTALCLFQRGRLLRRRDPAGAARALEEAVDIARKVSLKPLAGLGERALARLTARTGRGASVHERDVHESAARAGLPYDAEHGGHAYGPDRFVPLTVAVRASATGRAGRPNPERERQPPTGVLTAREVEILSHARSGLTNAEIAKAMHLSVPTIERRLSNMYRRLGVRNRAQAVGLIGEDLLGH